MSKAEDRIKMHKFTLSDIEMVMAKRKYSVKDFPLEVQEMYKRLKKDNKDNKKDNKDTQKELSFDDFSFDSSDITIV